MASPVRRKTARERDRELIAKAGPWWLSVRHPFTYRILDFSYPAVGVYGDNFSWRDVMEAAARELNRIAKESRRGR